jgi:hypothetical protein
MMQPVVDRSMPARVHRWLYTPRGATVEVVLVDVDQVPIEREHRRLAIATLLIRAPVLLVGAETFDLLLRHADEHDTLGVAKSCEPPPRHVLLPLVPPKHS